MGVGGGGWKEEFNLVPNPVISGVRLKGGGGGRGLKRVQLSSQPCHLWVGGGGGGLGGGI